MSDETVDEMLEAMARVERMRAYLEKTFGGVLSMAVNWHGESWEELRRKDYVRRVRAAMDERNARGENRWRPELELVLSRGARTKGSRSTARRRATARTGPRSPGEPHS